MYFLLYTPAPLFLHNELLRRTGVNISVFHMLKRKTGTIVTYNMHFFRDLPPESELVLYRRGVEASRLPC